MEATPNTPSPAILSRAWFSGTIGEFLRMDSDTIVGRLTTHSDFTVLPTQRDAWLSQIVLLKTELIGLDGFVFMEFSIPRMGRRVDTVIISGPVVFVVEFKVGDPEFDRAAVEQVWDYALDLRNFHEASHFVPIVPILISTAAATLPSLVLCADRDSVYRPLRVHPPQFRACLDLALGSIRGNAIDPDWWHRAPYRPTPTIIEAARALYAQHSVEAIARYDAGAENLRVTFRRIGELIEEANASKRKLICFLTGVPGAGKTLVGLNIATDRRERDKPTHAVFLSGNGPLVAVLREALTRDEVNRQRKLGVRVRKGKVAESVKAFIQNVHH